MSLEEEVAVQERAKSEEGAQVVVPAAPEAADEEKKSLSGTDDEPHSPAAAVAAAAVPDEAPAVAPAVLRLRGVPFAANEGNIMQFFAGAEDVQQPTEVYICRRNGEAAQLSPAPRVKHGEP